MLSVTQNYFRLAVVSERLHRLFLETIKNYLSDKKIRDINSVQCLILYNVGLEKITVGEFTKRGYYLGENVSYNLRKMVNNGYLMQFENKSDKRSSYVKLSKKGSELYKTLDELFKDHKWDLKQCGMDNNDFNKLYSMLNEIENFLELIKNG